MYNGRKELQQMTNELHKLEADKNDEIKQIKAEYENQIAELRSQ